MDASKEKRKKKHDVKRVYYKIYKLYKYTKYTNTGTSVVKISPSNAGGVGSMLG